MPSLKFSTGNYQPTSNHTDLQAGQYNVVIAASELRQNKKNSGSHIVLTLAVLDAPHKGWKVFDRLNIDNPNPTAVQLAYDRLFSICQACGVGEMTKTEQLHNIPMSIKYDTDKNGELRVISYKAIKRAFADAVDLVELQPPPSIMDIPDDDIPF